ncbi:MAG: TRAP transporter TatT component family protein [bacterium]
MVRCKRERAALVGLSAAAILAVGGCSGRSTAYNVSAAKTADVSQLGDLVREGDEAWARRENPDEIRRAIAAWEKVVAQDPTAREILAKLSRANYLLAYGHMLGEAQKDARLATYEAGAQYGERALALNPEFKRLVLAGGKDTDALSACTKDDAPALQWYYANLGRKANEQGIQKVLLYKEKLFKLASRLAEVDEGFFHGSGPRLLGTYYAKAPGFAGGDLAKSKQQFDRSLALAPNYFGTKVLMAEFYATKKGDKALFEQLLNEVANADPRVLPDVEPEQKIEQENARKLLARAAELF